MKGKIPLTRLCPLFSGSSGNSYYLSSGSDGILIDAGRSCKQIVTALHDNDIDINSIMAVFITHEHTDHIKGLRVLASKYRLKVYASPGTIESLRQKGELSEKVDIKPVTKDGIELDSMKITPFSISHDCAEGYGYACVDSSGRKTSFVTDTGVLTEEIKNAVTASDTIVLESNHDSGMLKFGSYPFVLKRRIMSELGHLSNEVCAEECVRLVSSGTTRIVLAHLSRENNIPSLAMQTSLGALTQSGMKQDIDYILKVAPVENHEGAIIY